MELLMNAKISCTDGDSGHLSGVILNPKTDEVTHLVVKWNRHEYMVPIDHILTETHDHVQLDYGQSMLKQEQQFIETEFVRSPVEHLELVPDTTYYAPYWAMETYTVHHERVPEGELAIKHGMKVFAKGEEIGRIDEIIINPTDHHVTHIVLREGHLWGEKEVVIGISHIKEIEDDGVYLKLTKNQIAELPAVPVRRHFWLIN